MRHKKGRHKSSLLITTSLLFFFAMVINPALAQDTAASGIKHRQKKFALGFSYENGYVFQTNRFVRGSNLEKESIKNYQAFSGRLIFKTTGKKLWHQYYNFPSWGFGLHVSDFHNPEEMGIPIAAYAFVNGPFHRWKQFSLNYEIDFGLTVNWRHFNPVSNQYNIAIGAGETVYIHTGITADYRIADWLTASLGIGLSHFSNGALKLPNYGLNTFSPRLEIKYDLNGPPQLEHKAIPVFEKFNSLEFTAFSGLKNILFDSVPISIKDRYEGLYFPVFGIKATLSRQVSHKSKFGLGITFDFDGSVNTQITIEQGELEAVDLPFSQKLRLSIFPSYELIMGPYALTFQTGFYIFRKQFANQVPVSYQRIGLNYHFDDNFLMGISLRAYNFHVSDFIEWSLGYQINWKKNKKRNYDTRIKN
jgi:hypothetical protein